MGKNNSSMSFFISLPLPLPLSVFPCKPLLVGEKINSRLVCLCLQEFVVVVVQCVDICTCVRLRLLFSFLLWEAG